MRNRFFDVPRDPGVFICGAIHNNFLGDGALHSPLFHLPISYKLCKGHGSCKYDPMFCLTCFHVSLSVFLNLEPWLFLYVEKV